LRGLSFTSLWLKVYNLYSIRDRGEEGGGVGEGRAKLLQARPGVGYRAMRGGASQGGGKGSQQKRQKIRVNQPIC